MTQKTLLAKLRFFWGYQPNGWILEKSSLNLCRLLRKRSLLHICESPQSKINFVCEPDRSKMHVSTSTCVTTKNCVYSQQNEEKHPKTKALTNIKSSLKCIAPYKQAPDIWESNHRCTCQSTFLEDMVSGSSADSSSRSCIPRKDGLDLGTDHYSCLCRKLRNTKQ